MDTDTSWVVEGASVALVTYSSGKPSTVKVTTVERFTTTQVVLNNGAKLRRDDLSPIEKRDTWSTEWTYAMPADDPRVADARAYILTRKLSREMPKLFENVTDAATAVEVLDEAARQIAELRQRLTR